MACWKGRWRILFRGGGTFLVWTTKDMGDWRRSEEKTHCAVNSKQKLTKKMFFVGSFLTCWLAGHFWGNLPLSTNDLEDRGEASRKGEWGFFLRDRDFFWGGDGECFPCINQRFGGWGRSEEKRRYAVNSKQKSTKNLFLVGSFLTCWLAGPFCQNLLLSTNDLEDVACWKGRWRILFRGGGILF